MTTASSVQRIAPVSTMVEPAERRRVDAAGAGLYRTIHRDSLAEVLCDLKERRISAVIVSVGRCVREEPSQMAAVVRAFPRIPTLALLSSAGDTNAETVLTLGNCGIRTLIDVRKPEGWGRLRALLGREATKDADRMVLAALREDLREVPDDCWRFFEALFSPEFRVSTVRQLARQLNVLPSTLMSRFFRAHLPAPKRYLAYARLIRAARLFENPGLSISDVANHLDYSSPQSFGRHVRTLLRITAGEFRCTYDGERMLDRFRRELIQPYVDLLRGLNPLALRPGMRLVPFPRLFEAAMQPRTTVDAPYVRAGPSHARAR
ncbi:MAG TPA: helix-turn-helix domain-containing protein [Gemmatimonadaceae bacterium]